MRRSRFSEEQFFGILEEHQAGLGAKELCQRHRVREPTFYKSRSKYGAWRASLVRHGSEDDGERGAAAEGAGSRERQAQEAAGPVRSPSPCSMVAIGAP